ncbi:MAG TPA: hypothetical protein VJ476_09065 [Rhizomicrobium sp.]|nr:hypothetical protein [Rhizomicrobium sp.]
MKFRLTYDGRLEANGGARHKHEIRRAFHPQLKRLWETDPNLLGWARILEPGSNLPRIGLTHTTTAQAWLAASYDRMGYHFVPLATARFSLIASIEVLFLRPDEPGSIIKSGDIDNRLKTLFDALQMPVSVPELGGYTKPGEGEDPFFVLMEDDRLLSHVSIETDVLLQPTPTAEGAWLTNDARLVITVSLKPYHVNMENLHFA